MGINVMMAGRAAAVGGRVDTGDEEGRGLEVLHTSFLNVRYVHLHRLVNRLHILA